MFTLLPRLPDIAFSMPFDEAALTKEVKKRSGGDADDPDPRTHAIQFVCLGAWRLLAALQLCSAVPRVLCVHVQAPHCGGLDIG